MNTYKVGDVANVRIVKLMTFGAFAEVVPGVDGLIPVSYTHLDVYKRQMPVAVPATATMDRVLEMAPQLIDRVEGFVNKKDVYKRQHHFPMPIDGESYRQPNFQRLTDDSVHKVFEDRSLPTTYPYHLL